MPDISLKEQFEEILADICRDNDIRYDVQNVYHYNRLCDTTYNFYNGFYSSIDMSHGYFYNRFSINDVEPRTIEISWDNIDCTLFELLYVIKGYMDRYLLKNYDWSCIFMKCFTKKDLKNGDVVVLRDYTRGIVIKDLDALITEDLNTMSLRYTDYDDDLTRAGHTGKASMDIMKVYRPDNYIGCTFDHDNEFLKNSKLIYERKEVEEMTLEEICKALGKEIKIVKEK